MPVEAFFQAESFLGTWSKLGDRVPLSDQWRELSRPDISVLSPPQQHLAVCARSLQCHLPRVQCWGVGDLIDRRYLAGSSTTVPGQVELSSLLGRQTDCLVLSTRHTLIIPLWRCNDVIVWSWHFAKWILCTCEKINSPIKAQLCIAKHIRICNRFPADVFNSCCTLVNTVCISIRHRKMIGHTSADSVCCSCL